MATNYDYCNMLGMQNSYGVLGGLGNQMSEGEFRQRSQQALIDQMRMKSDQNECKPAEPAPKPQDPMLNHDLLLLEEV